MDINAESPISPRITERTGGGTRILAFVTGQSRLPASRCCVQHCAVRVCESIRTSEAKHRAEGRCNSKGRLMLESRSSLLSLSPGDKTHAQAEDSLHAICKGTWSSGKHGHVKETAGKSQQSHLD